MGRVHCQEDSDQHEGETQTVSGHAKYNTVEPPNNEGH